MKAPKRIVERWVTVLGIVCAGALLSGCQAARRPVFADFPGAPGAPVGSGLSDSFRVGDVVTVVFSGTEVPLQPHTEAIKEDGKISPPLIGSVVAAGKSSGELQTELQKKYTSYYNNLTVTVTSLNRFYYVTGEVRSPGPKPYLGETDIVKAISAAGDFTDFAKKKKVRLTRSDGQTKIINVHKAIEDPEYDVMVYPGDKIVVPRRFF